MKYRVTLVLLITGLFSLPAFSQLNNGGLYSYFGVDADTRGNYMKYGLQTGAVAGDDWFAPSFSFGNNVIDTSNAAYYRSTLQAGINFSFNKRMSVPLYSKVNGKLWLDAAYGRDFSAASSLKDTTTFTSACKNGDDPSVWIGGVSSFPNKNDLVDVYAHMRRDGTTIHDSLWFFAGVSTYGTTGSRYYDIELYKKSFTYNAATGKFSSAGTDGGHTQWLFDASGNIIQTGDMIVAVNFSPGSAPVVDVRIWVSQATWSTVTPAYFNFNASYDGSVSFGYASVVSKTGTTAFGAGISNYSLIPSQDTTYATPWGSSSPIGWSTQYQSLQFIEVGLNLSRIGVDPALYTALGSSACESLFSNIFFKSRSSNSFVSNMQDFVTPLVFLQPPVMDYSLTPDTLRCNRTTGMIQITNKSTAGYYTWQTANGHISGTNGDSSQINITQPGTYIVSASAAEGCPITRTDTIVVPIDTLRPVATVNGGLSGNKLQLYGGDIAASNYSTPFGGSQGLLWNWSGPNSFSSTIQNPLTDTVWGTYQLTVTEKRNGCTATAAKPFHYSDFLVLSGNALRLSGSYANRSIRLQWEDPDQALVEYYVIEKNTGDNVFNAIGTVFNKNEPAGSFSYQDYHALQSNNIYRVRAVAKDGRMYYSGIITVAAGAAGLQNVYVAGNPGTNMTLVANTGTDYQGVVAIYSISGQTLLKRNVLLSKGINTIVLPEINSGHRSMRVVSLFIDGQVAWSQKAIF